MGQGMNEGVHCCFPYGQLRVLASLLKRPSFLHRIAFALCQKSVVHICMGWCLDWKLCLSTNTTCPYFLKPYNKSSRWAVLVLDFFFFFLAIVGLCTFMWFLGSIFQFLLKRLLGFHQRLHWIYWSVWGKLTSSNQEYGATPCLARSSSISVSRVWKFSEFGFSASLVRFILTSISRFWCYCKWGFKILISGFHC